MKILGIPTEIYSRVVGYFRPVAQWNKGKQQEFEDREYLKIEEEKDVRQANNKI